MKRIVPQDEAMLCRVARGDEIGTQSEFIAEIERRRFGIEEAVGSEFDLESAGAFGPDAPAGSDVAFEYRGAKFDAARAR